jgi:uncharacterized lipoprotein NlpE involved in copper resistance
MKKIATSIGVALTVFILLSCNESSKTHKALTEPVSKIDSIFSESHSSYNALDVEGEYKGMLPCGDCEAIKTVIVLNKDKSYIRYTTYMGKDGKVFEEKGFYSWNSEGNTITLSGIKNAPNLYFVGENKLIQLDLEGNRITGNLADKYILHK